MTKYRIVKKVNTDRNTQYSNRYYTQRRGWFGRWQDIDWFYRQDLAISSIEEIIRQKQHEPDEVVWEGEV